MNDDLTASTLSKLDAAQREARVAQREQEKRSTLLYDRPKPLDTKGYLSEIERIKKDVIKQEREYKAGTVLLDSGERISKEQYALYSPEQQSELKSLGVTGFNEWLEGQRTIALAALAQNEAEVAAYNAFVTKYGAAISDGKLDITKVMELGATDAELIERGLTPEQIINARALIIEIAKDKDFVTRYAPAISGDALDISTAIMLGVTDAELLERGITQDAINKVRTFTQFRTQYGDAITDGKIDVYKAIEMGASESELVSIGFEPEDARGAIMLLRFKQVYPGTVEETIAEDGSRSYKIDIVGAVTAGATDEQLGLLSISPEQIKDARDYVGLVAGTVLLNTGERVDKTIYNNLPPTDQQLLLTIGTEKYDQTKAREKVESLGDTGAVYYFDTRILQGDTVGEALAYVDTYLKTVRSTNLVGWANELTPDSEGGKAYAYALSVGQPADKAAEYAANYVQAFYDTSVDGIRANRIDAIISDLFGAEGGAPPKPVDISILTARLRAEGIISPTEQITQYGGPGVVVTDMAPPVTALEAQTPAQAAALNVLSVYADVEKPGSYNITAYAIDKGVNTQTLQTLLNAGYTAQQANDALSLATLIKDVESYGGDYAQWLRDNPNKIDDLKSLGIDMSVINQAQSRAGFEPSFDTFMQSYMSNQGFTVQDNADINKYLSYYSMPEDMRDFYIERDLGKAEWERLKALSDKLGVVSKQGQTEYMERYGSDALNDTIVAMITAPIIPAARSIRPDILLEDITTAEWIMTAANVIGMASIPLGVIPKIGGVLAKVLDSIAFVGYPIVTAMEWDDMNTAQKAISVGMDVAFGLLLIVPPVARSMRNKFSWLPDDIRLATVNKYDELAQAVVSADAVKIASAADDLVLIADRVKLAKLPGANELVKKAMYFKGNASKIASLMKNESLARTGMGAATKIDKAYQQFYDELWDLVRAEKSLRPIDLSKLESMAARIDDTVKPASPLRQRITELERIVTSRNNAIGVLGNERNYLDRIDDFLAGKSNTILNPSALEKLTQQGILDDYIRTLRNETVDNITRLTGVVDNVPQGIDAQLRQLKPQIKTTPIVDDVLNRIKQAVRLQTPELMANPLAKVERVVMGMGEEPVQLTLTELSKLYKSQIGQAIKLNGYTEALERWGDDLVEAFEPSAKKFAAAEKAAKQKGLPESIAIRGRGDIVRHDALQKVLDESGFLEWSPDSYVIQGTGLNNYTVGQWKDDIAKLTDPIVRQADGGAIEITLSAADQAKLIAKYGVNPIGARTYVSPNIMQKIIDIQKQTIKGYSEFGTGGVFKAQLSKGADWAIESKNALGNVEDAVKDKLFTLDNTSNRIMLSPDEVSFYTYQDIFIEIPTSRLNPNKSLLPVSGADTGEIAANLVAAIKKVVGKRGYYAAIMLYGEDLVKEVYPQALEAALIESEGGDMPSGTIYGTPVSSPTLPPTGGGTMTSTSIQTLTDAVTSAKPIWDAQSNVPLMSIDGLVVPTEFGVVTPQGIAVINSVTQTDVMGELEGDAVAMPISDTKIASPVSMIEPSTGLSESISETDVSVITRPSDLSDTWQFTDLATTMVTAPITDSEISTERQTMTVPETLSQTDIIQQPALVTDQVAVTTPIPIPVAQPIPEPIKRRIPKIPILADDEEMTDDEKREAFRGAVCFPANTPIVRLKDVICSNYTSKRYGVTTIDKIQVGDTVLSYNESTGVKENKRVTQVFQRESNIFLRLKYDNGNKLVCTPEHPIAILDRENKVKWIPANGLNIGDSCIQLIYQGLGTLQRAGKTWEEIYGYDKAKEWKSLKVAQEIGNKRGLGATHRTDSKQSLERMARYGNKYWVGKEHKQSTKDLIGTKNKGKSHPVRDDIKKILSEKALIRWANDADYRERVVKNLFKATHAKPNKAEMVLGRIIDDACPNEFIYNGDASNGVIIGARVPDFVNINGKKKVIELNGCNWHYCPICKITTNPEGTSIRLQDEEKKLKTYHKYGWDVLTIWGHELVKFDDEKAQMIKERIKHFVYNPRVQIIKVASIEQLEYNIAMPVYNLEVEENNNYYARGILVHNCWKQGIVYHAWKYPYEDDERDLATFYKEPPPGAVIIPGAKTAQETIQLYLGDTPPPPDRIINMGIMDINISTTQDGQLQIRYAEDAKQARGDKDAWFEGKEKRGAHTSRKKKKAEVESVSATNNDDFWSGSV